LGWGEVVVVVVVVVVVWWVRVRGRWGAPETMVAAAAAKVNWKKKPIQPPA
jgi:hypothetical protein